MITPHAREMVGSAKSVVCVWKYSIAQWSAADRFSMSQMLNKCSMCIIFTHEELVIKYEVWNTRGVLGDLSRCAGANGKGEKGDILKVAGDL